MTPRCHFCGRFRRNDTHTTKRHGICDDCGYDCGCFP